VSIDGRRERHRVRARHGACRVARNLTLAALAEKIDYTPEHIKEVQRATTSVSDQWTVQTDQSKVFGSSSNSSPLVGPPIVTCQPRRT
jgi:hypothetical protein